MKPLNHKEQESKNNTYFAQIFSLIIFLSFIVLSINLVSASNITFTNFDAKYIANVATATKLCINLTNGTYPVAESFGNPYAAAASWTGSVNIKYWDAANNQWVTKGSHSYLGGDPCRHPPIIRTLTCRNMNPGEISRLDFANSVEISRAELESGSPLPVLPSETAFMSSIESAKKICELKGYSDVLNFKPSSWCNGANWELAWDGSQWDKLGWAKTSTYSYGTLNYGLTCRNIACSSDSECNDGDLYTYDKCINPGTSGSYCNYTAITCVVDNDCGFTGFFGAEFCSLNDVFKNYQVSKCLNPGTPQSSCQVNVTPTFLIDCGENVCGNYGTRYCYQNNAYHSRLCNEKGCSDGKCFSTWREEETLIEVCTHGCSSGWCNPECSSNADCETGETCIDNKCLRIQCFNDNDCNDNNSKTEDKCINPGTAQSSCTHTSIACSSNSDCGCDGFLNMPICKGNNVYDIYRTFSCSSPGTSQSSCSNSSEERIIQYCRTNQTCTNGKCTNITCRNDSECNDNNPRTEDKCLNPNTTQSLCQHNPITCITKTDCGCDGFIGNSFCQSGNNNVFQNFVTYTCNNAGTSQSSCSNSTLAKLKTNCTANQKCLNGICASITCNSDSDCNDSNTRTEDKCLNPGTSGSSCIHTNITCSCNSDCGQDRFLGQLFCDNNNSFDKYITFTCNNPGTSASTCTNLTENRLVQNCTNGCSNGSCIIIECFQNSDCSSKDYYSAKYCKSEDIFQDFNHFTCVAGKCQKNITSQLVQSCDDDCHNGRCVNDGGIYNPDNENYPFESDNTSSEKLLSPDVYSSFKKTTNYTELNESIQKIETKQVETQNIFDLKYFWPIVLVVLLILLIILVILIVARY